MAKITGKPNGRPSKYSLELADKICAQLAEGISLKTVCKSEDMPSTQTVFTWMRTQTGFLDKYERAKEESADALIEDMLDIADDGSNDWIEKNDPNNPGYSLNGEHVQRSRLRVDVRKWAASKLKPKKYGDKIQQEHTNPDGNLKTIVINKNYGVPDRD